MIFFDVTKTAAAGHRSGLTRVSARLQAGLGAACTPVRWPTWDRRVRREDWFLTSELFSEEERPGIEAFLASRACRLAAVFHDAIPLRHPHITWPQSVARHPAYLKLLARFDRIWAVSHASAHELAGFWRWQGIVRPPPIEVLPLGADFDGRSRVTTLPPRPRETPSALLCVGIVEPRKNQIFLLEVCDELWRSGLTFELHIVGRVNPHFGRPMVARIKSLRRQHRGLHFHERASDETVSRLYTKARAMALPTLAEGCGLPLLESLWRGVPCVCSDLPSLRENAAGGGCVTVTVNDRAAWTAALRRILTDDLEQQRLASEAISRPLPTWGEAAAVLENALA
ncbi:MAG TPA: glycosyltransferase [Opitutaceae bacterium]|nr:glycosyltransferase [Opitutaceae bacterium]